MSATVLVTGATGLLGAALVPALQAAGFSVLRHGWQAAADVHADLTRRDDTLALLERVRPDVIVHLAALTDVDACEADPQRAYLLNLQSVVHLAEWIANARPGSHLVQISTDQVYDGLGPHAECGVCIRNTYASSKIAAELAASGVGATVLRTNFFGRSRRAGRVSFSDWLFAALQGGQAIQVFDDVLFSPLAIDTLALAIGRVVARRPAGVFNLGSRSGGVGGISKADFAFAFAAAAGLPTLSMTRSLSTTMTTLKAYRPKDMRMDSSRFERTLDLRLPELTDEIQRMGMLYREPA